MGKAHDDGDAKLKGGMRTVEMQSHWRKRRCKRGTEMPFVYCGMTGDEGPRTVMKDADMTDANIPVLLDARARGWGCAHG